MLLNLQRNIWYQLKTLKQESANFIVIGPITYKRIVYQDIMFQIDFTQTVFDFSNQSQVTIPITITTWTNSSDQLQDNYFSLNSVYLLETGLSNYFYISSQFISSNSEFTVYQTYVTMYNNYGTILEANRAFQMMYEIISNGNSGFIPITWQCFTVNKPFQPTIVTVFDMSPSNIVYSNKTSSIQLNIQIKGSQVNLLELVQFQTTTQSEYLLPLNVISNCTVISYSLNTLVNDIQCTIPVGNL